MAKERKSLIPLFHPGAKPPELMTGLLNHRLIVGKELKGGEGEGIWREREGRERDKFQEEVRDGKGQRLGKERKTEKIKRRGGM